MASPFGSRTLAGPVLSLADVLVVVAEHPVLARRRRQDLTSALRTVSRVLGKPLERIPADPAPLAQQLRRVAPLAIGMSSGRWANIRSFVLAAISLALEVSPGRHRNPMLPAWQAVMDLLPEVTRWSLSRFAHFCSAQSIEPGAVEPEIFSDYRRYLDNSLLMSPHLVFGRTARAWYKARVIVPGLSQINVPVPARGRHWTLTWDGFPSSLRRDLQTFHDRRAAGDPFENALLDENLFDEEPARPLRPATIAAQEWQVRAFASALVRCGYDPEKLNSLGDLIQVEAFTDGLRFLREHWGTKSDGMANVAHLLRTIARHHVRADQPQLERMNRIIRRLESSVIKARGGVPRGGLTEKNRERLRPFENVQNAIKLRDLPLKLRRLADCNPRPLRAAMQAQIAVAIELEIFTRMRIGNLVALDLEHNFRPGRNDELIVVLEAEDVKNQEAMECPLPKRTVELLDWYFQKHRSRLVSPLSTALFPGHGRETKRKPWFTVQIKRTIFIHTGFEFNPHLFRHFTAMLYLDRHPGGYEVVRRALGHRTISTTVTFYTGREGPAAVRHFHRTILQLGAANDQSTDLVPSMPRKRERHARGRR